MVTKKLSVSKLALSGVSSKALSSKKPNLKMPSFKQFHRHSPNTAPDVDHVGGDGEGNVMTEEENSRVTESPSPEAVAQMITSTPQTSNKASVSIPEEGFIKQPPLPPASSNTSSNGNASDPDDYIGESSNSNKPSSNPFLSNNDDDEDDSIEEIGDINPFEDIGDINGNDEEDSMMGMSAVSADEDMNDDVFEDTLIGAESDSIMGMSTTTDLMDGLERGIDGGSGSEIEIGDSLKSTTVIGDTCNVGASSGAGGGSAVPRKRSSAIDTDDIVDQIHGTYIPEDNWKRISRRIADGEISDGDGNSTVSDEDYYRQDYFMLGGSGHVSGGGGEFSKSEQGLLDLGLDNDEVDGEMGGKEDVDQILEEIHAKKYSTSEMKALTEPDTPKSSMHSGSDQQSYAEYYVDGDNPKELLANSSKQQESSSKVKDYKSHFEKMLGGLSFEEDQHHDHGNTATNNGEPPQDVPKSAIIEDDNDNDPSSPPKQSARHVRTSSKDNWSPFPASNPKSERGGQDIDESHIDESQNDFASILKQAIQKDKSPGRPAASAPPSQSSNNDFSAVLKERREKLRHQELLEEEQRIKEGAKTAGDDHGGDNDKQAEGSILRRENETTSTPKKKSVTIEENKLLQSLMHGPDDERYSTPKTAVNKMLSNIDHLVNNMSPEEDIYSPSTSSAAGHNQHPHTPSKTPDVIKNIVKENRKLRKRRKELLTLLSSTAQQFSAYEKVCSQKICKLEEQNRLLANPDKNRDVELAKSSASSLASLSETKAVENNDQSTNNMNSTTSKNKLYDGEVVRRLSNGVLMQEKQLKSKDELITQLKLRCEVLKQSLMDRDGEILQDKKLWEEEKASLLKKLEGGGSSPVKQNHGELLTKKMEITRLKKELETALSDITMLTTALETNNVALDAAVLELDKLQEWKAKYAGESAPSLKSMADAEKLRNQLAEKEEETTQLQEDLESSLKEIEELRKALTDAAAAKGYDDFHNVVEDLKNEVKGARSEAELANEKIARLEAEVAEKNEELRVVAAAPKTPGDTLATDGSSGSLRGSSVDNIGAAIANGASRSKSPAVDGLGTSRRGTRLLNNLRIPFGAQRQSSDNPDETQDYPTMVRQRDLKIKSLEAMIHSNEKIMEKMKLNIEKMDSDKEDAEFMYRRQIDQLEAENKTYELQVAGFEKAFMNLNDQRTLSTAAAKGMISSSEGLDRNASEMKSSVLDENMFMWDEQDTEIVEAESKDEQKALEDLRAKNMSLQRMITELQSSGSFQEDQIETLKAELVKLRVVSQQEKESAVAQMSKENKIVTAQRSALEAQLIEINKSARNSLGASPNSPGDGTSGDGATPSGSDPVLVAQVVMLEKANKVLESSVDSLRSDMQEKLAPLLTQIAMLEEEKRMIEEEMQTKLNCREMTINNLEDTLKSYQNMRFKTKSKGGGGGNHEHSESPDKKEAAVNK